MEPNTNPQLDYSPVVPRPAKPKSRKALWAVIAVLAVIGLIVGAIAIAASVGNAVNDASKAGRSVISAGAPDNVEPGVQPTTETPKGNYTLTTNDVRLSLTTTSKECYGYGVGCNVGYKVRAAWTAGLVDPESTWDVNYTVTGGEDGPVVGTLTLNGDGTYYADENMVSTKSKNTTLKIKINTIEKNGI